MIRPAPSAHPTAQPVRCAVVLFSLALVALAPRTAPGANALLVNGSTVSGDLAAADEQSITLGSARIPLEQIVSVDWGVRAEPASFDEMVFFLNGDRVAGKIVSASTASRQVVQTTAYGERSWHAPGVSKLVFDNSPATWERIASDLPVAAYPVDGDAVPGDRVLVNQDLVRITSQVFGKRDMERRSVAFAVLTEGKQAEFPLSRPYLKILLQNGDTLSGSIEKVADGKIAFKLPFYTLRAEVIELPVRSLSRMIVINGGVTYLGELEPAAQKNIPYLFTFTSPARTDSAFTGGPVSVAGRVYLKGLCTRARTELTYKLGGKYKTFEATVGVDDSILAAGGSVRFLVYANDLRGKPLFDSGLVPSEKARSADVRVDVSNAAALLLVTDWGPKGDIGAHGDWAAARLIKK